MSIIKGKTNIVAGFGGTKRNLGEVFFSQSNLATDNSGALPGWTGEYYENGKTLFPDLYNFVKADSTRHVTKEQYDNAIAIYGECPKYIINFPVETKITSYKYNFSNATGVDYLSNWDFYYEENQQTISITDKTFYFKQALVDIDDHKQDKRVQAFADPALTKPVIAHKHQTVATALYNVLLSFLSPTGNNVLFLYLGLYAKDSEVLSSNPRFYWAIPPSYVYLPLDYAYEETQASIITNEETGALRLPKYANYIKMANSTEGITQKGAGLPNITGSIDPHVDMNRNWSGALEVNKTAPTNPSGTSGNGNGSHVMFDASKSNAIYGAADTVQPAHTTLYPWISAYTSAIPASVAQAAQFTNALSGKANTDLSNVLANIDYVVDRKVPTESDPSWYEVWKSGKVRQGGTKTTSGELGTQYTFLKPFANAAYTFIATPFYTFDRTLVITEKTATTFKVAYSSSSSGSYDWIAEGQGV